MSLDNHSGMEIFGILNITDDSFFDGGRNSDPQEAFENAAIMLDQGASYIDVGAESTRPGATPLTDEEEWRRLEPVLPTLIESYPGQISLDTYHPQTARRALEIGRVIINDVTSFSNDEMIDVVAEFEATCIISHIPDYVEGDIQKAHRDKSLNFISVEQVREQLLARQNKLIYRGIERANTILDPGFGFAKTPEVNMRLLSIAKLLPERDVMLGYSMKSSIGEHRKDPAVNLELGRIAKEAGTRYLRLHQELIPSHMVLTQT